MQISKKIGFFLFDSQKLSLVKDFESYFSFSQNDSSYLFLNKKHGLSEIEKISNSLEQKIHILSANAIDYENNDYWKYYSNFDSFGSMSDKRILREKLAYVNEIIQKIRKHDRILDEDYLEVYNLFLRKNALVNFRDSWYRDDCALFLTYDFIEKSIEEDTEFNIFFSNIEDFEYCDFIQVDKSSLETYYKIPRSSAQVLFNGFMSKHDKTPDVKKFIELIEIYLKHQHYSLVMLYQL